MSAQFLRASSQRLVNSAPRLVSTGYPLSVGFWFNMLSVSATFNILFSYADTGADNHSLRIQIDASEILAINAVAGGTSANGTIATAIVAGAWNYVVGRFITATNRRISCLRTSGITHGQNTTSRAPTSLDTIALGISQDLTPDSPCDALIAEFWYADRDIQPGGGVLDNAMVKQLAFGGPLSVPIVANNIVEYLPLRDSLQGNQGDYAAPRFRRGNWTNTNGVILRQHPPLPTDYRHIRPWRRLAIVPPTPTVPAAAVSIYSQRHLRYAV